jgi:hypothetical protein
MLKIVPTDAHFSFYILPILAHQLSLPLHNSLERIPGLFCHQLMKEMEMSKTLNQRKLNNDVATK